jgi:hypothetical protein
MKRTMVLLTAGLCLVCFQGEQASARKYKKVDSKGIANMVFASKPIPKNKERTVKIKKKFTPQDKIYARAYFPRAIGRFKRGEELNIRIWLDGKVIWRGGYSGRSLPNPGWKQMQIWIRNTKDDAFRGKMGRALDRATSGTHRVTITLVRDKFLKYKYVKTRRGVKKKPIYKPVVISKGTFKYVVK